MASAIKNLSDYAPGKLPDISQRRFALVVSEYHHEITEPLFEGAVATLLKEGAQEANLIRLNVPGAFELSLGSSRMAARDDVDAVIALGCVVQGETKHFDFICQAVAYGITQIAISSQKSVSFGLLTPNTYQQALDRAGGKHGNKGIEAAIAAIKML